MRLDMLRAQSSRVWLNDKVSSSDISGEAR